MKNNKKFIFLIVVTILSLQLTGCDFQKITSGFSRSSGNPDDIFEADLEESDNGQTNEVDRQEYIDNCITVSMEELARYPEKYDGINICLETDFTYLSDDLVACTPNGYMGISYNKKPLDKDGKPFGKIIMGDSGTVYGQYAMESSDIPAEGWLFAEYIVLDVTNETGETQDFPKSRIGFYSNGYWALDIKNIDNDSKTILYDGYEYAFSKTDVACLNKEGTIIDADTLKFGERTIQWEGDTFTLTDGMDAMIMSSHIGTGHDVEHGAGAYVKCEKPLPTATPTAASIESEYILPKSNRKKLTDDDINALTADQQQMAINEIYARHGRKFTTPDIQDYFNKKSWYQGTIEADQFNEDLLSSLEKDNILVLSAAMEGISSETDGFIGIEGTYSNGGSDDPESGEIHIYNITNGIVEMAVGTQRVTIIIRAIQGTVIDNYTVVVNVRDAKLTMVWSDPGTFTITREGDTGSDDVNSNTDNSTYVNKLYYHIN